MKASNVIPPVSVLAIGPSGPAAGAGEGAESGDPSAIQAVLAQCWPEAEIELVPDLTAGRRMLSFWVPELVLTVFPPPGGTLSSLFPSGGPPCVAITSSLDGDLLALEAGADEVARGWDVQAIVSAYARIRARRREDELDPVPKALHPYFTGIAHEVNNPLTVLQTGLEQLALLVPELELVREDPDEYTEVVDEAAEMVSQCQTVAGRIMRVTRRLMALQRVGDTRVQDVRPEPPVKRALERLAVAFPEAEMPVVRWHTHARVHAATLSIEEGLYEMLHNAMLASPKPGSVEVEVVELEHAVEFRVRDQGGGVEPDVRRTMFAPFKTTRAPGEGPGLGLTLVQAAARRCGGEAGCSRPEGGPTEFWFQLPLGVSLSSSGADAAVDGAQKAPRVLLFDPDEVRGELRIARLEPELRVIHATNLSAVTALLAAIRDWAALLVVTGPTPEDTEKRLEVLQARDSSIFARDGVFLVHDAQGEALPRQSRFAGLPITTTDTLSTSLIARSGREAGMAMSAR